MDMQKFGAFIQSRRKELGMTQGELGSKINVTDKAISRWERSVGFPDIKLLEPLAEALQISVQELVQCERMKPEQIAVGITAESVETTSEMKKESQRGKCRRILAKLCFLVYILFYVLSGNPQFAEQSVWIAPLNTVLFLATVLLFLYVSYREVEYGKH